MAKWAQYPNFVTRCLTKCPFSIDLYASPQVIVHMALFTSIIGLPHAAAAAAVLLPPVPELAPQILLGPHLCCQMAKFGGGSGGAIQGKEGIKFCHLATQVRAEEYLRSKFRDRRQQNGGGGGGMGQANNRGE